MKNCLLVICSLFFLQGCELAKLDASLPSNVSDEVSEEASSSVTLHWFPPTERVNGEDMEGSEIGGYEVRYRDNVDKPYEVVVINDGSIEKLLLIDIPNVATFSFEVAVFDTNGIYSDFVVATD